MVSCVHKLYFLYMYILPNCVCFLVSCGLRAFCMKINKICTECMVWLCVWVLKFQDRISNNFPFHQTDNISTVYYVDWEKFNWFGVWWATFENWFIWWRIYLFCVFEFVSVKQTMFVDEFESHPVDISVIVWSLWALCIFQPRIFLVHILKVIYTSV